MRLLCFAAGLLWVLLASLLFVLATVAFDVSSGGKERVLSTVFLLALSIPVAAQLRTTHRQLREMTTNRIVLKSDGIEIRLTGRSREWKGLSDIPETDCRKAISHRLRATPLPALARYRQRCPIFAWPSNHRPSRIAPLQSGWPERLPDPHCEIPAKTEWP